MTEEVREWLAKAENDLDAAKDILSGQRVHCDLVCFLCQQSAEKLIKGSIIAHGTTPPKTHDLVELHRLFMSLEPSWKWDEAELHRLSRGAVLYRYPGESAEPADARWAYSVSSRLRSALLALLGQR